MSDLNNPPYDPKQPLRPYQNKLGVTGFGTPLNIPTNEFDFSVKPDADNYLIRAQNQGFGEQLGITLGNAVANIPIGLAEMVGYGAAALTEWGNERDYSNALTEAMKSISSPFGEVYRTNPNTLVDLGDSAWWLNTFGDLAVSAGTFALGGAGLGAAFSKLAKSAALALDGTKAAKIGMDTAKLLGAANRTAQVATAASLAYAEGAMSGLDVYEKTFASNFEKLSKQMSPEDASLRAQKIASNAAATTVQLNTILNTGLNMIQLMPFFSKADNAVRDWTNTAGKMQKGETAEQFASRMKAFSDNSINAKKVLGSKYRPFGYFGEAGSEALEELNNVFAERTGYAQGEEGATTGMLDQFKALESYFDYTMNAEGALAASLGAIGGIAQAGLIDYAPIHRIQKVNSDGSLVPKTKMNADGVEEPVVDPSTGKTKYQKQWVSGITRKYNGQIEYLNSIADSLAKDAQWFDTQHKEMQNYVKNGDLVNAALVRSKMMDVTNMNSVALGRGENVVEMYRQIESLDNNNDVGQEKQNEIEKQLRNLDPESEEYVALFQEFEQYQGLVGKSSAMLAGFASQRGDTAYKDQARRAIERVNLITEAYKEAEDKFGYDESDRENGIQDYMFRKIANQKLQAHNIKEISQSLAKQKAEFDSMNPLNITRDSVQAADVDSARKYKELTRLGNKLNNDILTLEVLKRSMLNNTATAEDRRQFQLLMEKYGAVATGSLKGDMNTTIDAIKVESERIQAAYEDIENTYKESVGFTDWEVKNPGKSWKDYSEIVTKQFAYSDDITELERVLEEQTTDFNINTKQLTDLKTKGLKNLRETMRKEKQKRIEEESKKNKEQLANAQANALANNINNTNLRLKHEQSIESLRSHIARLQGDLKSVLDRIASLKASRKKVLDRFLDGNWHTLRNLNKRAAVLEGQIIAAQEELTTTAENPPQEVPTPDVDQDPVVTTEEDVIEEVTSDPVSDDLRNRQIQNWLDEVSKSDIYLTAEELKELLKAHTENALDDDTMEAIISDNIRNLNMISATPVEIFDEMNRTMSSPNIGIPDAESSAFFSQIIDKVLTEYESPSSGVPSDSQLYRRIVATIPWFKDRAVTPYLANKLKELVDSMHKEEMTFEELTRGLAEYYGNLPEVESTNVDSTPEFEETISTELPTEGENTNPVITDKYTVTEVQKEVHEGMKAVNADHVANTTLRYTEQSYIDGTVKKFIFVDQRDENGNLVMDIAGEHLTDPSVAAEGSKVFLSIPVAIANLVNGKIDDIDEFPIEIKDEKGRVLGNIHTVSWAMATRVSAPGESETYRNVAGSKEAVEAAAQSLRNLRKYIADAFNSHGARVRFTTNITRKSPGVVHLHRLQDSQTQKPKFVEGVASKLLPDTSLKIGVMLKGVVKTSWNIGVDAADLGMTLEQANKLNGYPVVLLPTANGSNTFGTLYRESLAQDESSPAYATLLRLIELYVGQNSTSQEVATILKATGHNVLTPNGLRALLNEQLTETTQIRAIDLASNDRLSGKLMLQISGSGVSIGAHGAGRAAILIPKNGEVSQDARNKILELLKQRFRTVSIENPRMGTRGVNSSGEFSQVTYNPDNGEWAVRNFPSYNEFLKANTTTLVDGTAKDSSGKYRYTANPRIELDMNKITYEVPKDESIVSEASSPIDDSNVDDDLGFLSGEIQYNAPVPKAVYKPLKSNEFMNKVMTMELLTDLYNQLPASQRNGKTIAEVLQERVSLGHTFITDGDNPFRRCS